MIDYKKGIKSRIKKLDKKVIGNAMTQRAIENLDIVARHTKKHPEFYKKNFMYHGEKFTNYSVRFNDNYELTGTTLHNLMKTICHYFERDKID